MKPSFSEEMRKEMGVLEKAEQTWETRIGREGTRRENDPRTGIFSPVSPTTRGSNA
jgi:hypothetical protein